MESDSRKWEVILTAMDFLQVVESLKTFAIKLELCDIDFPLEIFLTH